MSMINIVSMLIIAATIIKHAECIMLELKSGQTKCITEDIKDNALTVAKYAIVNPVDGSPLPDTHTLDVRVFSPNGNNYHKGDRVESGNFAFTAAEMGEYTACFWSPDHSPPATFTIDFDWRTGVAAKHWSKIAKKGQIDTMELELTRLQDMVQSIHDEMFYLREREEEMQLLNRATTSKMANLSFLSILVCASVAALQLWHLKNFFERKKLL
ncbi:hypothetical protein ACFE04_008940 [Oxalis oulophora]